MKNTVLTFGLISGGLSAAMILATVRTLKLLYDDPLTNAALTFVQPFPIGLVISAISAAILRKR